MKLRIGNQLSGAITCQMPIYAVFFLVIAFGFQSMSFAQSGNRDKFDDSSLPKTVFSDTTIVFVSPRPLISDSSGLAQKKSGFIFDVLFSNNGFGFGFGYQKLFSNDIVGFLNLGISGARNTDELEYYDPFNNIIFVPNKVNRLFMLPITAGIRQRLFSEDLSDSFRPYVSFGVGGTLILATPYVGYEQNFFAAFGNLSVYPRAGGFLGLGANIGSILGSSIGVDLRYYVIPFGGGGLESIKDLPIKDFGGLFIALSVGSVN